MNSQVSLQTKVKERERETEKICLPFHVDTNGELEPVLEEQDTNELWRNRQQAFVRSLRGWWWGGVEGTTCLYITVRSINSFVMLQFLELRLQFCRSAEIRVPSTTC